MNSRSSITSQYVVVVLGTILALVIILIGTSMEGHNKTPAAASKPFLVAPVLKLQNSPATVPTILDVIATHQAENDSIGKNRPLSDTAVNMVAPVR